MFSYIDAFKGGRNYLQKQGALISVFIDQDSPSPVTELKLTNGN